MLKKRMVHVYEREKMRDENVDNADVLLCCFCEGLRQVYAFISLLFHKTLTLGMNCSQL